LAGPMAGPVAAETAQACMAPSMHRVESGATIPAAGRIGCEHDPALVASLAPIRARRPLVRLLAAEPTLRLVVCSQAARLRHALPGLN